MQSAEPRLGGGVCWWVRFSQLLLPHPCEGLNSSVLVLVTATGACFTFSSELVLLCRLSKLKQMTKPGSFIGSSVEVPLGACF